MKSNERITICTLYMYTTRHAKYGSLHLETITSARKYLQLFTQIEIYLPNICYIAIKNRRLLRYFSASVVQNWKKYLISVKNISVRRKNIVLHCSESKRLCSKYWVSKFKSLTFFSFQTIPNQKLKARLLITPEINKTQNVNIFWIILLDINHFHFASLFSKFYFIIVIIWFRLSCH